MIEMESLREKESNCSRWFWLAKRFINAESVWTSEANEGGWLRRYSSSASMKILHKIRKLDLKISTNNMNKIFKLKILWNKTLRSHMEQKRNLQGSLWSYSELTAHHSAVFCLAQILTCSIERAVICVQKSYVVFAHSYYPNICEWFHSIFKWFKLKRQQSARLHVFSSTYGNKRFGRVCAWDFGVPNCRLSKTSTFLLAWSQSKQEKIKFRLVFFKVFFHFFVKTYLILIARLSSDLKQNLLCSQ